MVNNDNKNYTFFWTPGRIFNPFLAFEISQPVPQHEAIIVQTNGKMILTDQLIIEDRKEERRGCMEVQTAARLSPVLPQP